MGAAHPGGRGQIRDLSRAVSCDEFDSPTAPLDTSVNAMSVRILLVSEGNPELPFAFSGIGKFLVDHLRAEQVQLDTADVALHGARRALAGAASWSPRRARWVSRYRGGDLSFYLRTQRARSALRTAAARYDALLQFGATFAPDGHNGTPYFLYCDSNKLLGRRSGFSPGAALTRGEYNRGVRRERGIYDAASGIFVFSDRVRNSFIEDFGVAPEKVATVYAGPNVDLARIPTRSPTRDAGQPPTVLFVGREFERKGGDVLLAAFRRVRRDLPDARLTIIGPRDLPVTEPGVESLGFLRKDSPDDWQKLVAAYASADVFCFPTRYEPFGIVLLEAMFFGLPCVASDAWAIPEIIVEGETGFRVPVDDVPGFADRLLRLLGDPLLARRMGMAGLARANATFTWQRVVRRMLARMQSTLAQTRPASP